jgi:multiple sugar transport system substrate-binding protein
MKRAHGILSFLALLVVLSLVACGPTTTTAPVGNTRAAANTPAGEVNLRLWVHQNVSFEAGYQKLVNDYMAAHPNVNITMETFNYDTYIQTLQTTMPAGQEADILQMFGTWTCGYADRLAPAPADVMTVEQAQALYYAAPIGGYVCDGKLYGLPQEFNIEYGGVLINKQTFLDAGLTYPPQWQTWADVMSDAKAMTKYDAGQMSVAGFDFVASDPTSFSFLAGILQRGGDFWNADHTGFTFNTPQAKETLQWMLSMVKDDQVVDPVLFNDSTNWVGDAFFAGKVAIGYIGPWAVSQGLTDYPDFGEFGYAVLPYVGDKPIFVADSGWGLTVSPNSKNQAVAWDFVKFAVADRANALQWNITTSTIPAIPDNANSAELASAHPWITVELPQLPNGRYLGAMPDRDTVMYQVIYPHVLNVLQGVETVDEALKAMDAEANGTFQ